MTSPVGPQSVHGEEREQGKQQCALARGQPHVLLGSPAASAGIENGSQMLQKFVSMEHLTLRKPQGLGNKEKSVLSRNLVKEGAIPEPKTASSFWNVSQCHLLTRFSNCRLKEN